MNHRFTSKTLLHASFLLSMALLPACGQQGTRLEQCINGVDDDADGAFDCDDAECQGAHVCRSAGEDCVNGLDDDSDGLMDCADPACTSTASCVDGGEACAGGLDEDGDALVDCDDPDCVETFLCLGTSERCTSGDDDDGDGLADCDDPDCSFTSACLASGEACASGQDEDGDGAVDCADSDCALTYACLPLAEDCTNGLDDDDDGALDCADEQCTGRPVCLGIEVCNNGRDDDGDGDVDCVDSDCSFIFTCLGDAEEVCDNDGDDDGDALVDCDDPDCSLDLACPACGPGTVRVDEMGVITCEAVLCELDEFVSSNQCVACPPGSTNDASDDASRGDTGCDPILCGVDEFVSSNMCVLCPPNSTNDPADDASGMDTACDDPCSAALGITCDDFEQGYLKSTNPNGDDVFGFRLAVSGDTLVVGALGEDSNARGINGNQNNNGTAFAGAAYVFVRTGDAWSEQAYLKASNAQRDDGFGESVAVSGDTVVVGASSEESGATGVNGDQRDNSASISGAAYVFTRTDTLWSQQAYLKPSNTPLAGRFGFAVSVSGDTIVVGSPFERNSSSGVNGDQNLNPARGFGSVYLFTRAMGAWTQSAYIKASNPNRDDQFGRSLSLSGNTLAIGAPYEDGGAMGVDGDQSNNSISGSGAVYMRKVAP